MSKDVENEYECSIKHFIDDQYSICREERQYAVFLYNILRKYHSADERKQITDKNEKDSVSKIFAVCRIKNADIENVFYEATFMRDFFERNRRFHLSKDPSTQLLNLTFSPRNFSLTVENSFNAKLIKYVTDKRVSCIGKNVMEVNLGHNAVPNGFVGLSADEITEVRQMMNAKPDIAIVYNNMEQKNQKQLLFLECKFESNESSYEGGASQSYIQGKIADFLCQYYLNKKGIVISEEMKPSKGATPKSCLVRFVRKKPKKSEETKEIWINELINLNKRIFGDQDFEETI